MSKRTMFLTFLLAAGVICVVLWMAWEAGRPQEEVACLSLGYLDITASAPLFVAQHLGYFQESGLCVETERFTSSNQLVDAIAASRVDFAVEVSAAPALALQLRAPGRFYLTAASTISEAEPFDALLVRATSEIDSLSDLEGARIAVFPGTTAQNLLDAYLQSQNVDTASTIYIPTPPANLLASLKSKAVDVAHVYEPAWTIGKNDPEIRELHGTVYGRQLSPNPQGVSLLNRETATRNPKLASNLVDVFDRALKLMRDDPETAREALRAKFDLPGDTVSEMNLLYMSAHDQVDWASLGRYVQLLFEIGELEGRPDLTSLRFE